MWWKELKRYLWLFILGAILIAVYKTFDNLGYILDWAKALLGLLTPFIVGGCIAYLLYIPCRKIETLCLKTKFPFLRKHRRGIAVISIYLVFFAAVTILLFSVVPALTKSISDFIAQLPALFNNAVNRLSSLNLHGINNESVLRFLEENLLSPDKWLKNFTLDNVNRYAKSVMTVGHAFFDTFMGIIISIYILFDRHNLKNISLRIYHSFIPKKHQGILGFYARKINEFIHLYISCQLLDALIVFGLSFVVLSMLRTRYALLLAFIMGSFNLIPYFGAIVATILSALITAFTKDFTAGLIVAAAMIVLQQIDSNFIQPRLVSDTLNLAPFWVIFAIVVGGGLFGILGIFLSVPLFALLRIIILDVLDRREKKPSPAKTE